MRSGHADTQLETLASRARDGDRDAFAALVEQSHATVYRLVLRMLSDAAESEDVVQETYFRAWRALPRLRQTDAVLGWLCRIARHAALDRVRKRKRRPIPSPDEQLLAGAMHDLVAADDPGRAAESAELRQLLLATIASLDDKYRVVFLLREVDGMSYDEIAQALGCPVGTVESRLHRARHKLAAKLTRAMRIHEREVRDL